MEPLNTGARERQIDAAHDAGVQPLAVEGLWDVVHRLRVGGGSSFCIVTRSPRVFTSAPRLVAVGYLPREAAAPPVTKKCMVPNAPTVRREQVNLHVKRGAVERFVP